MDEGWWGWDGEGGEGEGGLYLQEGVDIILFIIRRGGVEVRGVFFLYIHTPSSDVFGPFFVWTSLVSRSPRNTA